MREADFGPTQTWRGFLADGSTPLLDTQLERWSRHTEGGLERDDLTPFEGGATGRLASLNQGYLAFRLIKIAHPWDFLEFSLHNAIPGNGEIQLRVYYGAGEGDDAWEKGSSPRHGYFYKSIALNFKGWRTFRLTRRDFSDYGGPIGWYDAQLFGVGFSVTRAPTLLTDVHVAAMRLIKSPIAIAAAADLQQSGGETLQYELTIANSGDASRTLQLRVDTEPFAYSAHEKPFVAQLSQRQVKVAAGGAARISLRATPTPEAAPGDAITFAVVASDPNDASAQSAARIHAAIRRKHPVLSVPPLPSAPQIPPPGNFEDPPALQNAREVMQWLERAADAYLAGNLTAGRKLADEFRTLGDPDRGYRALCTQTFYPISGTSSEPASRLRTWYQGFWWDTTFAARAYDKIYESDLLSQGDKRRVEDNFLRPLGWMGTLYLNACANGQESRIRSVIAMGLATQDPDLIRHAIDGNVGFTHAIGHDLLDGITLEGTIDYMGVTWGQLVEIAEMASFSGIDLFHKPCPIDTDRAHLYEADLERPSLNSPWAVDMKQEGRTRTLMDALWGMTALTYPDGRVPSLNDTPYATALRIPRPLFTNPLTAPEVRALFGTPKDAPEWAEGASPYTSTLKRPSRNLPASGLAVMRTGDGNRPEDQYLLLKYGPHGGVHGHRDKLEFVYWRYGKELAPDPPICDLSAPAWGQYYQQTASHNAIVIDETSQQQSSGEKCLTFAPLPGAQVTELEATTAYSVQQTRVRRLALMTRDYVLIYDRVISATPHTIDFLAHGAGLNSQLSASVPLHAVDRPLGEREAYSFIQLMGEAQTDAPFCVEWNAGDGVKYSMRSLEQAPCALYAGRGFEGYRRGGSPARARNTYSRYDAGEALPPDAVAIVRRNAQPGETRFMSLLEATTGESRVESAECAANIVTVHLKGGVVETVQFSGGDVEGAPTACEFRRETNGVLTQLALIRKSASAQGGPGMLRCPPNMTGCSVSYVNGEASVQTTDSGDVAFIPPVTMGRTTLNGQETPFTQQDGLVSVNALEPASKALAWRPASDPSRPPATAFATTKLPTNDSTPTCPAGATRLMFYKSLNGALAWSPDGRLIAASGYDGEIKLWEAASGTEWQTIHGERCVLATAFSPDGNILATGDREGIVRLWDIAKGTELRSMSAAPTTAIQALLFTPDGRELIGAPQGYKGGSGDERAPIVIWDVASGAEVRRLYGHFCYAFSLALSPDAKTLATSGFDENSLRLWDLTSGMEIRRMMGHQQWPLGVAYSPNGKTIASASEDKTVRLWDPATGQQIGVLPHRREVYGVAFSPDGSLLATASQDGAVRLFETATWKNVRTLEGHPGPVWSIQFSPNGKQLACGAMNGSVVLWDIATSLVGPRPKTQ